MSLVSTFQADSEIVNSIYDNNDNYLIEYNFNGKSNICAVYFSSNNIYYPNTESSFKRSVIDKNRYEWYGTRINYAKKHIFIRDIKKQWYLTGINSVINSPEKLVEFLVNETKGYEIVMIGSSAGGYASVLYGSIIKASLIMCFNGQFEILSLLERSCEQIDPIVFRFFKENKYIDYFDARNFIKNPSNIVYFYSVDSFYDDLQYRYVSDLSLNILRFKTARHGIPVFKCCLDSLINKNKFQLISYAGKIHQPFIFSVSLVGFFTTIHGFFDQSVKFVFKKILR